MKDRPLKYPAEADRLIDAITKKLQANRSVLERSINRGRLSWRINKRSGEIEVDLEPKI